MKESNTDKDGELKILSAAEIPYVPQTWIWEDYLPDRTICLVKGRRQSGKSRLMMRLAVKACHLGPAKPYTTLYGTKIGTHCEMPAVFREYGGPAHGLVSSHLKPLDDSGLASLDETIAQISSSHRVRMVILDTLPNFLPPDFEADYEGAVRSFLWSLNKISERRNVSFLLALDAPDSPASENLPTLWEECIKRQFHIFRDPNKEECLVVGVGSSLNKPHGGPPFHFRLSDGATGAVKLHPEAVAATIEMLDPGYDTARRLDLG